MKKITKIIMPIAASLVCVAPMVSGIASCSCNTNVSDAEMLAKINKVLKENETKYTMNDALVLLKSKDLDVVNIKAKATDGEYVWDQSINRFAIINSKTGALIQGTDGYELNANKWQLWKMVSETTFDSYCKYSQYLKAPTTNALSKTTYSFIAGFDCGSNTTVKDVHYFYEKMDTQTAKDVIINTCSFGTNVDISAWKKEDGSVGDVVKHYGNFGDLTIVTNNEYKEYGHGLYSDTYEGTVNVEDDAEIKLVNVKTTGITVQKEGELKSGKYTILTSEQSVIDEWQAAGKGKEITQKTEEAIFTDKQAEYTEQKTPISYVFDATDGTNIVHFNSLSDVAKWSNEDHAVEAGKPSRTFEGWTITLNKDYDMSLECESWVPIGNDFAGSFVNAFKGTFDGNGHSIINFNLKDTTVKVALFGVLIGTIKNFNIVDSKHTSTQASNPMVVVWTEGDVVIDNVNLYNCQVECNKSNGLFMWAGEAASEIKITNCYIDDKSSIVNTAGANTAAFIGQLCDFTKAHFENVTTEASVTGYANVGGIVGQYGNAAGSGVFKDCKNTGKITITDGKTSCYCGGLVGYFNSGNIKAGSTINFENCENSGTITSTHTGILNTVCGGLYGFTNVFSIACTNCKNSGKIGLIENENEDVYVCNWAGGFSGYNNVQDNTPEVFIGCTNEGTIYATNGVGHLATCLLGDQQYAQNCTIKNGKLVIPQGAKRIIVPGEE